MISRILVAYDGTGPAQRALELGLELARNEGAEVGIVTVTTSAGESAPEDPWSDKSERAAELEDARQLALAGGLVVAIHEPAGAPGPAIVEVAEDLGYDMIVIGSRHLSPIQRAVLGSVSRYVITHAKATVVVAR